MKLIGAHRLGRIGYSIGLGSLIGFDFAKAPIATFVFETLHAATAKLWANVPDHPDTTLMRPLTADELNQSTYVLILNIALPAVAVLMTLATFGLLVWIISGRLRDIGLPQYSVWIALSPFLLTKFFSFPELAIQAMTIGFFAMLGIIAIIPPQGGSDKEDAPPKARRLHEMPEPSNPIKRSPGQFGRRGLPE
jgi:uncharacterized membrane protein YhaH (DUF805 family)